MTKSAAIATISALVTRASSCIHRRPLTYECGKICNQGTHNNVPDDRSASRQRPLAAIYLPDSSEIIGPISSCRRAADNW